MSNQLQQRTVAEMVSQYSVLYGLPPHKAFLFLIIEKYLSKLELNSIDIEESIIDGSDDCGIDAIVIDEETETHPHIYFFQSKYYQAEDAFTRVFEGNALEKIQSAVNDFVLEGRINSSYQNEQLVDKLHSVKNLSNKNPIYTIVFCSNSKEPAKAAKTRLEDFIRQANRAAAGEYLTAEYVHLERIAQDLIAPIQQAKIDLEVQISGKYLTEDTGDVRLFVAAVEANDLVSLVDTYGDDLFERNVRGLLKSNNEVNKSIFQTATGQESPYFIYMNNGLTITCEKFTHTPITNSPTLKISNAQIVNGQQTARSLYKAFKEKKLKSDVKVLVRLVETTDPELLMQIVEATNSQTKVTSRDLHSNDHIQKLIERHLVTKGYFYEARANKYKGKETSKRIDAEIAAQAYYAICFNQPALAKDKKKLLFGSKYDELFNEETNPEDILYSFRMVKQVQNLNKKVKYEAYSFLKDATLHTAALMHKLSAEQGVGRLNIENEELTIQAYEQALEALALLVRERNEEEGDKYEHRRTFKDITTFGRAIEIMLES